MVDPLSTISLVLELTPKVIDYIVTAKDASKERQKLLAEVIYTSGVVSAVKDVLEYQQGTNKWARTVINSDGITIAIEDILDTLRQLSDKLEYKPGLHRVRHALTWPFKKHDVQDILNRLSRSKQDVVLRLQQQSLMNDIDALENLENLTLAQQLNDQHHQKTWDKLDGITSQTRFQELQRAVDHISTFDHRKKHHLVSAIRTEGTNNWLFETSWFKEWFTGSVNLLMLHGGPGVGKTVLMSAVIDFIEGKLGGLVNATSVFVYLDYKERSQQTYYDVLCSIVKQVLQSDPIHIEQLRALADDAKLAPNQYLSFLNAKKLLSLMAASLNRLYLMIDAFDESESVETQTQIVDLIEDLQSSSCLVKVLVTARSQSLLLMDLPSAAFHELKPSIDDIRSYISSRTQSDKHLRRLLRQDPNLQSVIMNTVLDRGRGMFLLARLHMDTLANSRCLAHLDEHLEALPYGSEALGRTYSEAVERIRSQDRRDAILAERILIWVCFSSRALKINELQQAIAIEVDKDELDFNERRLLPPEDLIALCAGLVIIDPGSEEVRLVHHTTQEFFDHRRETLFPDARKILVDTCIKFLSYKRFQWCESDEAIRKVQERNPILRYVVDNIGRHFREAGDQRTEQVVGFLLDRAKRNFVEQIYRNYWCVNPPDNFDLINVLSVATRWELNEVVGILLDRGFSVNYRATLQHLPLHSAGYQNITELLHMFLDIGADPVQRDHIGNTALHAVAVGGDVEVARKLCKEHPDLLNVINKPGATALHDSVRWRNPSVTAVLVEAGADPCVSTEQQHMWPVRLAYEEGHFEQVKRIFPLHRGKFEGHDLDGCNVVHILACANLADEIEEVVRDCPQIINKVNQWLSSPLHDAVARDSNDAVRILLRHGADCSLITADGRELLCWAAARGNVVNLKQLLAAGADPSNGALWKTDELGQQPLSCVAAEQAPEIMQVLLQDPRFDYAATDDYGISTLHRALWHRQWATASVVLQHDLLHGKKFLGLRNAWGLTPLHDAAQFGGLRLVQELIDAGSELSTVGRDGLTELDLAVEKGHTDIADLLRSHGARRAKELVQSI